MEELKLIFEMLKDKYDLIYTTTFALNDGYMIDVPVIRGKGKDRHFDLYMEDDLFVFSVELYEKQGEDKYSHTHPYNSAAAIKLIEDFLAGHSVFD